MLESVQTSTAFPVVGSFFADGMYCIGSFGLDVLTIFGVDAGDEGPGVDEGREDVGEGSRDLVAGSFGASWYTTFGLVSSVATVSSVIDESSSSLSPPLRRATKTHAKTDAAMATNPVESAAAIAVLLIPSDLP